MQNNQTADIISLHAKDHLTAIKNQVAQELNLTNKSDPPMIDAVTQPGFNNLMASNSSGKEKDSEYNAVIVKQKGKPAKDDPSIIDYYRDEEPGHSANTLAPVDSLSGRPKKNIASLTQSPSKSGSDDSRLMMDKRAPMPYRSPTKSTSRHLTQIIDVSTLNMNESVEDEVRDHNISLLAVKEASQLFSGVQPTSKAYSFYIMLPMFVNIALLSSVLAVYFFRHEWLRPLANHLKTTQNRLDSILLSFSMCFVSVFFLSIYPLMTLRFYYVIKWVSVLLYAASYATFIFTVFLITEKDNPGYVMYLFLVLVCSIETEVSVCLIYIFFHTPTAFFYSIFIGLALKIVTFTTYKLRHDDAVVDPIALVIVILASSFHTIYVNFNYMFILKYRAKKYRAWKQMRILGDMWIDMFWVFPKDFERYLRN